MSDASSLVGQALDGKYRIEKVLGAGGMGSVFLATHLGTDRIVAVKVILDKFADHEEFMARFQREARAAGRLRHPNIVDITDFGHTHLQGQPLVYLVMEYLEGSSLSAVLEEEGRLSLEWVVDLTNQLCAALQVAHDRGILHRDLKPDNLWLVPNGQGGFLLKILDFGLAKLYDPVARRQELERVPEANILETQALHTRPMSPAKHQRANAASTGGEVGLTEVGTILGTPAYMSPEQCRGARHLDPRSDLYSVGVILYQMLSGETPFKGDSLTLLDKHIQATPPDLGTVRPDLPKPVVEVVKACLNKDPEARPEGAAHLGAQLRAGAMGFPQLASRAMETFLKNTQVCLFFSLRFNGLFLLVLGLWCVLGHRLAPRLNAIQPDGLSDAEAKAWFFRTQEPVFWWLLAGILAMSLLFRSIYQMMNQFFLLSLLNRVLPQKALRIQDFFHNPGLNALSKGIGTTILKMIRLYLGGLMVGLPLALVLLHFGQELLATVFVFLGVASVLVTLLWDVNRLRKTPLGVNGMRFLFLEILEPDELAKLGEARKRGTRISTGEVFEILLMLPYLALVFLSLRQIMGPKSLLLLGAWGRSATLLLLVLPFFCLLVAEGNLLTWDAAGVNTKAILSRLRTRFFPGKSWFEREA